MIDQDEDDIDEDYDENEEDNDENDEDKVEPGRVLHVIDIQSGDILQSVRLDLQGEVSAVRVDGDEIYIAGFSASKVTVLQYAGSEA